MKTPGGFRPLALALFALAVTATTASAQWCPLGRSAADGYTLHFTNGEAFRVDKIIDDVSFVRHLDNRGNTLNSQELYKGLLTLATFGGKGRTVYTYDVDPAVFFPMHSEGYAEVGGQMIPENGRPSRVYRTWAIGGSGTKYLNSGPDREGFCLYNYRMVASTTVWPELGLQFRQEKQWSDSLNMVLYLRTTVIENGVETRVREYEVDWITD
ncbi:hypothetical protein [Microbaculum marinum]|uniref:Uncharacterized protein n=1 Tax=Microbaculum marinum TaxID=1764581 RepID=A0AAW9S2A0_9HYPH